MEKKKHVLLWMVISMLLGYLPWYNFSAVLKYIATEFHLSSADTGMILAAFQAGYVVVVLFTGWLADKIGTRKVVLYATLLTGIFATAFVFVAHDKLTVLIMRLLTGCACGAIYAPGMALLSEWFPPSERGGALGAYTAALTAAYAGGYFVASPIAAAYGWRVGMLCTSIPAFLGFLIVLLLVPDKPPVSAQYDGAPAAPNIMPAGIRPAPEGGYGGPVMITAAYMGHMWELYAFWGWIGPYMVACASAAGMAGSAAVRWGGLMAAFITLIGALSVWLMGIVADRIGRTKAILLGATCSLVPEFFFGYLIGKSLALILLVGLWIGFWVISDSAIYKAGLTDMVSEKIRATILGVQSAVGFSMTILAPLAFGWILQAYNGTTDPTTALIWGPSFLALGIGAIAAPVCALILRRMPQAQLMAGGKM